MSANNNPLYVTPPQRDDLLRILTAPNAGAHNAVYRGKELGDEVTDAQWAAIAAGSFDDLYICDYWVKDGIPYRLAAFDYFLNCGDLVCAKHHAVIVPDVTLYSAKMNTEDTTKGGYINTAMYASNLAQAETIAKAAFGDAHILTKRELLSTVANNGVANNWSWRDSKVELMNEVQTCGSVVFGTPSSGFNVASGNGQFPLFAFDRSKMCIASSYWLRDICSSTQFSVVGERGNVGMGSASAVTGVRPYFCIY